MKYTKRNSSFELIRLLAQFYIVIYHVYLTISNNVDSVFNQSVMIPMHIGVPIFVLISGYFGIHPSIKGFINLISKIAIYTIITTLFIKIVSNEECIGGGVNLLKKILIISNSPYWFMRTYICLYLFAPILNKFLYNISLQQRLYALLVLTFISIYIGTVTRCDYSLSDGKNLVNFSFLYFIGNTLREYHNIWNKFNFKKILCWYISLNLFLLILYFNANNSFLSAIIWNLSFPYCSPLLILNSVLFVLLIAKFSFKSNLINYLASSSLAIYLIHGSDFGMNKIIKPIAMGMYETIDNDYIYLVAVCLLSIIIIVLCILIDKSLSPIWLHINKFACYIDEIIISKYKRIKL